MNELWNLPLYAEFGGRQWSIRADFRQVLSLLERMNQVAYGNLARGYLALAGFYPEYQEIPKHLRGQAMEWFLEFLQAGYPQTKKHSPKLIDWKQDQRMIVAEINRVAGCEVRQIEFVHWWTFLSWFSCIGEGQLATVVRIRQKLRTGKKLEPWEQEYFQQNRAQVMIKQPETSQQQQERRAVERWLEQMEKGGRD